ncbi:MAG: ABC transporter ATP-binding protein [Brevundimonas sp.]|uniref:ABC transporter ATP-binding protein n=1 Tax=Brevundimonas sp. TaxID=1871086 RepID=UPI002732C76D|nr:ABC transporter ATP-binding protein [Brevundimonas sp.]MDP3378158.1 ABC transporter ATP-binding protein [Brevundimonas sp.]
MTTTPRLQIESLSLSRGCRTVVRDVSLSVMPGELVALVGPNGAGKTSLIQAVCGLLKADAGRVRLEGADLVTLGPRDRAKALAYLPQDGTVAWNLPALEVVALGAVFLEPDGARARAMAALEEVEAGALADRGVAELSGGERARVLLARVLASEAGLILADEPVAGLDPEGQLLVLERVKARAAAGQTVVASLHDLSLAARFADRVITMDQGEVCADGPPVQALSPAILRDVFGLAGRWLEGEDGPVLTLKRL